MSSLTREAIPNTLFPPFSLEFPRSSEIGGSGSAFWEAVDVEGSNVRVNWEGVS